LCSTKRFWFIVPPWITNFCSLILAQKFDTSQGNDSQ
jgi:hypothetical protein